MKILFSPSETKNSGGVEKIFDQNSFIFPELFNKRVEIINSYNDFLKTASISIFIPPTTGHTSIRKLNSFMFLFPIFN